MSGSNIMSYIVLTAPNSSVCSIYQKQLNYMCKKVPYLQECRAVCVSDPDGIRIGSGGGTLNALRELVSIVGKEAVTSAKVVLIHSGGDSQRSPLNTISGKAWSTLNSYVHEHDIEGSPIVMLMNELVPIVRRSPSGTVIVASSDVLVNLTPTKNFSIPCLPENGVTVITVAEPLDLAKNHKPSVQRMLSTTAAVFVIEGGDVKHTLVDTGIVVLSGNAVKTVIGLCEHPVVSMCTEAGLTLAIAEGHATSFSAAALRFDLYSDFLHALCLDDGPCDFQEYLCRLPVDSQRAAMDGSSCMRGGLRAVWDALRELPLFGLYVPAGVFYHLGTSTELQSLLCAPLWNCSLDGTAHPLAEGPQSAMPSPKLESLSKKYGLRRCVRSVVAYPHLTNPRQSFISINSCVSIASPECIGVGSVIDNCVLYGCVRIGEGCILSHIGSALGDSLVLPAQTMMQQIPLRRDISAVYSCFSPTQTAADYVVLILGVRDDMKAASDSDGFRICGQPLHTFLTSGECEYADLWPAGGPDTHTLWTAKLFPVVDARLLLQAKSENMDISVILSWFTIDSTTTDTFKIHIQHRKQAAEMWKGSHRLALFDILREGCPVSMASWRLFMKSIFNMSSSPAPSSEVEEGEENVACTCPVPSQLRSLSSVYKSINTAISDSTLVIMRDFSHLNCDQVSLSVLLAIFSVRLCLVESWTYSEHATDIVAHMHHSEDSLLSRMSETDWRTIFNIFDNIWVVWFECELTTVAHHYMLTLVDFFGLSTEFWSTFTEIALHVVSSNRYPRLLLLCEWLRSQRIITEAKEKRQKCFRADYLRILSCDSSTDALKGMIGALFGSIRVVDDAHMESSGYVSEIVWTAQTIIRCQLSQSSQSIVEGSAQFTPNVSHESVSFSTGPVRIDIAGGWSDTAPISYEYKGAVVNMAVNMDGVTPLWCACFLIPECEIRLRSLTATASGFTKHGLASRDYHTEVAISTTLDDFYTLLTQSRGQHVAPSCALLKACVMVTRVVNCDLIGDVSLSAYLHKYFGGGIDITSCARIPSGSGMGGSSILAAVVIKSLHGLLYSEQVLPDYQLVDMVSQVEQLLTTGGGWQDQVGGLYGGVKMCHSNGTLPLAVSVSPIPLSQLVIDELEERIVLIYSGVQRLAKNTLLNALTRHALYPIEDMADMDYTAGNFTWHRPSSIVPNLIANAQFCYHALKNCTAVQSAVDTISFSLNRYWQQKKVIAWGTETPDIRMLLRRISCVCSAASACGAGAGGFVACVLRGGQTVAELSTLVEDLNAENASRSNRDSNASTCQRILSVHSIGVNMEGVMVRNITKSEFDNLLFECTALRV